LLLYNLFDIVQSSSSAISVVGLTSRSDTLLLFEKRVKSRFGHRQIDFYPPSRDTYLQIALGYLTIPQSTTQKEQDWNSHLASFFKKSRVLLNDYYDLWNDIPHLQHLILTLLRSLPPEDLLSSELLETVLGHTQRDLSVETIQDLSLLQICLVVAAMKLIQNQEHEMNFEMVYDEFRQFTGRIANIGRGLGRFQFTKKVALQVQ
jgi:origin recognition complex subunit 4